MHSILHNSGTMFRKYHLQLSLVTLLPVLLVTITGILIPVFEELGIEGIPELMVKVHSGAVFGSDLIYSVLVGLGLLGLLATGVTMTGLFSRTRKVDRSQLNLEEEDS